MNFLCIYLREKGGGGALMHVYVWEHIVSLYYRTALWMFTNLGRYEVLMVPTSVVVFRPDPSRGCCFWFHSVVKFFTVESSL